MDKVNVSTPELILPLDESSQQAENSLNFKIESIKEDLQTLHSCIQALSQMVSDIGDKGEDCLELRQKISKVKSNTLSLSREIHSKLTEIGNLATSPTTDQNCVRKGEIYRKKLESDYKRILKKLKETFVIIQQKEVKYPSSRLHFPSKIHNETQCSKNAVTATSTTTRTATTSNNSVDTSNYNASLVENINEESQESTPFLVKKVTSDPDLIQDVEDEKQLQQIEEEITELVEIFQTLNDSVVEQEPKVVQIKENVSESKKQTESATKHLKKASKYATAGLIVGGVALGAVVGGPVGALAAGQLAASIGIGVGIGVAVGAGLGGLTGVASKPVVDTINGARKKSASQIKEKNAK